MRTSHITATLLLSLVLPTKGLPEDPSEYAEWENKMLKSIEELETRPKEEAIPKLGGWVVKLNLPNHKEREGRPVFTAAQDMLLNIPGHAEYFGKKVTEYYDIVKQGYAEGKSLQEIVQWAAYTKNSSQAFQVLSLLPSAETVRVLGKMLEDDWKWPEFDNPSAEEPPNETLGCRAMIYLMRLPIANPPTGLLRSHRDRAENVHLWKQWYAEIESGKRTFRFIGDATEYDLRGPSKRGAREPGSERAGKRPVAAGQVEPAEVPVGKGRSGMLPWIIALGAVVTGAGVLVWRRVAKS